MNSCINILQHKYRRDGILTQLPNDLIHQILFYYTNTYQGLYFLRTINKEWKVLAESSLLWISCKLVLYCPKAFLRPLTNLSEHRTRSLEDLQRIMRAPIRFYSDRINLFALTSNKEGVASTCLVICDEKDERSISDPPLSRNLQGSHDSDTPLLNKIDTDMSINSFERCRKIFNWFHILHGGYVRMWNHRIGYVTRYYNLADWMEKYFEKSMVSGLIAGVFLVALSMYGWFTLEENKRRGYFGWENHLSFICLYLACLIDCGLTILDVINQLSYQFKRSSSLSVSFWDYSYAFENDAITLGFLSTLVFLVLIHIILVQRTSGSAYVMPWRVLLGPVWFAVFSAGCCLAFGMLRYPRLFGWRSERVIAGFAILFVTIGPATSLTLLTTFYDGVGKVKYPAGYSLIPLFPFILLAFVLFGAISLNIISRLITGYDLFNMERVMDTPLHLGLNIGTLFSSIVMTALMILLVVEGFLEQSVIPSVPIIFQFALLGLFLHGFIGSEMFLFSQRYK